MTEERQDLPEFDETVGDGPIDGLPPGEDGRVLMRQRALHGLLRTAHTADPEAATARVERVLAEVARGGKVLSIRRMTAVAAGLLVAGYATVRVMSGGLPPAERLLAMASKKMHEDVDRLFDLQVSTGRVGGKLTVNGHHILFVRPGHRFLLWCRGKTIGNFNLGCDGSTVWYRDRADPADRWSEPWGEQNAVQDHLARMMILDLGYLDIEHLVKRIPGAEQGLRTVGREPGRRLGEQLVRIEADGLMQVLGAGYRNIVLLVGESSGMVERMELDVVLGPLLAHFELRYVADLGEDETRYTRPW